MGRISQKLRKMLNMGYNIQYDEDKEKKEMDKFKCDYAEGSKYEKCKKRYYLGCGKTNEDCPYRDRAKESDGKNVCPYEKKKEYVKCNTKCYSDCACQADECPYTRDKLDQMKKEEDAKKVLVVNKANIKRTKIGKFSVEVWPVLRKVKEKTEETNETIIARNVSSRDDEVEEDNVIIEYEVGEGHMIRRLRDLDGMKNWKFIDRNSEEIYDEVLKFVRELIDDATWNVTCDRPEKAEQMRKQIIKSVDKAIRRKKWSFKKLEDILDGHQIFEGTERQEFKEEIIAEVRDYLNAFVDEIQKTDAEEEEDRKQRIEQFRKQYEESTGEIIDDDEEKDCKEENGEAMETVMSEEEEALRDEMKRENKEELEDLQDEANYIRNYGRLQEERKRKNHGLDEYGQPETDEGFAD